MLYKIIRKTLFFTRDIFEYLIYAFWENKEYNIDYLKKTTGLRDEDELWKKMGDRKKLLVGWIGTYEINLYNELFTGGKEEKTNHAELICKHIFDLLGSGPKKINLNGDNCQLIDWQLDFRSGYRWDSKLYRRWIRFGNVEGADIIVPWEQSRFQDRMALAQAYKLTDSQKFVVEFQNQVSDWIESNRLGFGVNWFCTMDIAIRAANWLVIKELFETSFDFPETFLMKIYGSLYDHGRYIRKHLQRFKNVTTNHYISGIVGLLCIALYFPFFKRSKEWLDFAVKELETEIEKQVYPDGCDYEASISYHLLVLEIFFYALVLCERADVSLSESYKAKVKKMFEVTLYCIKPDGRIPQIGDNDNGRLFKFSKRPVNNHKYLLSLAAIYYKDSNFKLKQFELYEEAFWIFGEDANIIWDTLSYRENPIQSKSFPNAGWYIIRHNNDYCFISCGPNGQGGRGGHAHNDKLSFELMLDGQDIIVDPGTYVYTSYPEERNKFRSTEYHNTIKFDGYEQNEILDNAMHFLPDKVKIMYAELIELEDKIMFQGEIEYADIRHKRVISLNKKSANWQIKDSFSCANPVNAKLMFHLSPELTVNGNNILGKGNGKKIASIEVDGYELIKYNYDYSPEYGVKVEATCISANIFAGKEMPSVTTYIQKYKESDN